MISALRRIWKAAPIATVILGGALLVGAFFAVRLVAFTIYWSDPAHRNQAIEPWMTPGYVAHSWGIPREALFQAIDLPPRPGHPQSIEELAAERGVSVSDLEAQVMAAIEAFRTANPMGPGAGRP